VRRFLIRNVLPLLFCAIPILAAVLVFVAVPEIAKEFYLKHFETMDALIVSIGGLLFIAQMIICWLALRWGPNGFRDGPERWIGNLAHAAEWFPMLGLIGTVGGILQTFSGFSGTQTVTPSAIISKYAPAITATGSGLFMAFINILPSWIVLVGRDLIKTLGGGTPPPPPEAAP
jgi:MotA/TolQ/ExbB proton channel family protein